MQKTAPRPEDIAVDPRQEDLAYTTLHAISCLTNDIALGPGVAAVAQTLFDKKINISCNDPSHHHDHGHGHDHDHDHHHHDHGHHAHPTTLGQRLGAARKNFTWKGFGGAFAHNFKHWIGAEAVSDLGAVPLVVATQRLAPGFMNTLSRTVEPLARPFFRRGAERSARIYAQETQASPEVERQYADRLMAHEMGHLGQVVMWNVYKVGLSVAMLMKTTGDKDWEKFFKLNLISGLVSNGILLGTRAVAPGKMQAADAWNDEHIVQPVARLFGLRPETTIKGAPQREGTAAPAAVQKELV
jgi:hypothetical protein